MNTELERSSSMGHIWRLWILLLVLATFGPLMDIVTGLPVNWLLGVLVLAMSMCAVLLWLRREGGAIRTIEGVLGRLPIGTAFGIYLLYFIGHGLRPSTDLLQTLFALRWPLIGFASYMTTSLILDEGEGREKSRRGSQLIQAMALASLLAALYGLFQAVVGLDNLKAWGLTQVSEIYVHEQANFLGGVKIFRIFGPLRRNEALGAFLYLGLVASGTALLQDRRPKLIFQAAIVASLPAIGLTLSLASIGTLVLWFLGVLVLLPGYRRLLFPVGVVGLLALFGLNLALNGLITARIEEHMGYARRGSGRFAMVSNWAAEMEGRSFAEGMFGTGVCTGLDAATLDRVGPALSNIGIEIADKDLFRCEWTREVRDTWYGTLSLEIGWLGLALFWLPLLVLGFQVVRKSRVAQGGQQSQTGILLGLGALALWPSGWVGALFAYMPVTAYFWNLVALAESENPISDSDETGPSFS